MAYVRRIRITGAAPEPDDARLNSLRGRLSAIGVRFVGPSLPVAAGNGRASAHVPTEQGPLVIYHYEGRITIYCELLGIGVAELKETLTEAFGISNPTIVEDEAAG